MWKSLIVLIQFNSNLALSFLTELFCERSKRALLNQKILTDLSTQARGACWRHLYEPHREL